MTDVRHADCSFWFHFRNFLTTALATKELSDVRMDVRQDILGALTAVRLRIEGSTRRGGRLPARSVCGHASCARLHTDTHDPLMRTCRIVGVPLTQTHRSHATDAGRTRSLVSISIPLHLSIYPAHDYTACGAPSIASHTLGFLLIKPHTHTQSHRPRTRARTALRHCSFAVCAAGVACPPLARSMSTQPGA